MTKSVTPVLETSPRSLEFNSAVIKGLHTSMAAAIISSFKSNLNTLKLNAAIS